MARIERSVVANDGTMNLTEIIPSNNSSLDDSETNRMHTDPYYIEEDPFAVDEGTKEDSGPVWKLLREENFSDWKIVVEMPNQDKAPVYYVHRGMLASGQVRSEYFAAQFRSEMRESHDQETRVSLNRREVKAFEFLLDLLYSDGSKSLAATTKLCKLELLPVLHHVGSYFGTRQLCEAVLQVCRTYSILAKQDKIEIKSYARFVQSTLEYDEPPMKRAAANIASHAFQRLGSYHSNSPRDVGAKFKMFPTLIAMMDPEFFLLVMHLHKQLHDSSTRDRLYSVFYWFRHHRNECDPETFRVLTGKEMIQDMEPDASYEVLQSLVRSEQEIMAEDNSKDLGELSNLQQLVADCMKANWNVYDAETRKAWLSCISGYSVSTVAEVLGRVLDENNDSLCKRKSIVFEATRSN